MILRIADFWICKEDIQIFHLEIPNQFHLLEIGIQYYKSVCETVEWIQQVLFIIPQFLC